MFIYFFALVLITGTVQGGSELFDVGNGRLGVNFLGFQAGVNVGHSGKLQADAGTPWGAKAGAGIQGEAGDESAGLLYAGATAGGGISAAAGLEGKISGGGSYGSSYAGASAGGKQVEIIKEKSISSSDSGEVSAAYKHHVVAPLSASFTKNIQVVKKPIEVGVVHEIAVPQPAPLPPPEAKPITTVIQKTVIPNYEKKVIKVPSYEERVVRVPTVVEKEVWVPAAPTIIEKEVQVPQPAPPPPPPVVQTVETVPVFYKTKFRKHPHFHLRKHFSLGGGYGGGYSGGYTGAGGVDDYSGGSYTATVTKTANPQFFSDIINIPVSALGAVNKLLTGISSGVSAGGSFGLSKSIGVSKSFAASGGGSAYY